MHFLNQLEQYFNHDRWGYPKKPLGGGGGGGCTIGLHQVEALQRIPMDIFPRLNQGQSLF